MSSKYKFRIESFNEYDVGAGQKRFDCIATADGIPLNLPLKPNLREPKKNTVVEGILSDIKATLSSSPDAVFIFPDPIHIACESVAKEWDSLGEVGGVSVLILNPSGNNFVGHGILNGGHRKLALRLAKDLHLDLRRVKVPLCFHTGIEDGRVAKLAIQSNSSTKVSLISKLNAQGYYDDFKDWCHKMRHVYPWIAFYENQSGVPSDPRCTISHLLDLLAIIDSTTYNTEAKVRHPISLIRSGAGSRNSAKANAKKRAVDLWHLIPDILELEIRFYKSLEKYCKKSEARGSGSPLAGVTRGNFQGKTFLPNGESYNRRIHHYLSFPLISSFRVFIKNDKWTVPFEDMSWELMNHVWNNTYKGILANGAKEEKTGDLVLKDMATWDKCYFAAAEFLVKYLNG